jgi:hypothetical protein
VGRNYVKARVGRNYVKAVGRNYVKANEESRLTSRRNIPR